MICYSNVTAVYGGGGVEITVGKRPTPYPTVKTKDKVNEIISKLFKHFTTYIPLHHDMRYIEGLLSHSLSIVLNRRRKSCRLVTQLLNTDF